MAAYASVPKSSVTTLVANTPAKVPAVALANRLLLKIFNDDAQNAIYYGDVNVSTSNGIYIGPGGESDWIPCSGDIYVLSVPGTTVRALEFA